MVRRVARSAWFGAETVRLKHALVVDWVDLLFELRPPRVTQLLVPAVKGGALEGSQSRKPSGLFLTTLFVL